MGRKRLLLKEKLDRQRALAVNFVDMNKDNVNKTEVKTMLHYGANDLLQKAQKILVKRNSSHLSKRRNHQEQ